MNAKEYLKGSIEMLKRLQPNAEPSFGLMTPQHMVEHLIWTTKSTIKDMGPAPDRSELSKKQLGFMRYVESGKPMEYRPSDKTKADLPPLRMESLAAAVTELGSAVDRFLADLDIRGDKAYYNPVMGIIKPEDMLSFHHRHFVHHLEAQYGLG